MLDYNALTLASMAAALLALAATAHADDKQAPPKPPLRVLFVGNSYIYTHALPIAVSLVAESRGIAVEAGMLAEPDFAIEDHYVTGAYEAMLDRGWDWVVLQQGPSSLPVNREHLRVWTWRATNAARARGVAVALMSAWPALGNAHTWRDAELSYHLAAIDSGVCVFPVSTAWRLARETHPGIGLYEPDQLHPERTGTLLAALVIVRSLFGVAHKPGSLNLALDYDEPAWTVATDQSITLDRIAQRAIDAETQSCRSIRR